MRGTGPIKSKWVCLYFFMYWDADAAVLCFGTVPYLSLGGRALRALCFLSY